MDACPTSVPRKNCHVGLTPKQSRFVAEYLIDLSGTRAAIRAGYSVRSADTLGPRLVRNSRVAARIAAAIAERVERTNITQDEVLTELATIGFSDMRTYAEWGPRGVYLKDSALLPADARSIAEVSQTHSVGGGSLKIRLHAKVRALELLGRHVGIFPRAADGERQGEQRVFIVVDGQRVYF